jgi:CRP-like cAMP-binding protein
LPNFLTHWLFIYPCVLKETLDQIKTLAGRIFEPLREEELQLLYRNLTVVHYHPHEIITKQGAFISHFIIVKYGLIKIYMEGAGDKTIIINLSTTGDLVGLQDLFGQNHSGYSAATLSETEVFLVRTDTIRKLASENPLFGNALLEEYCRYQSFLYTRLFSLGTKQMHGRLSDAILYLTGQGLLASGVFSQISRKEIADLCGMSSESVVRLLKEFRDDGLITHEGKEIRIKNIELLERLSRIG